MAFGANAIFDVRNGGSDSQCGGAFDPGATTNMSTNGAVTLATSNGPQFSSADYSIQTGDIGAWVYLANGGSGNHAQPGWYQITAQVSGVATLSAAVGAAYYTATWGSVTTGRNPSQVSTVAGCSSDNTATLSSITWTIDYSQQVAAQATGTATNSSTTLTATTAIFNKGMVGNFVTDGTTWKEITGYTSTTVVTLDSAPSWTSATIYIGGALATPGKAGGLKVAGNDILWKYNASAYTLTTASSNVSGGIVSDTTGGVDQTNPTWWVGYDTTRTLYNSDANWPTLNAGSQNSITLFSITGQYLRVCNIIVDGNGASTTSSTGFLQSGSYQKIDHIKAQNCESHGINLVGGNGVSAEYLSATGCSGTCAIRVQTAVCVYACESYNNTTHGFLCSAQAHLKNCISSGNTGATTYGFKSESVGFVCINCVAYGNGKYGFDGDNSISNSLFVNCIAEGNGVSASGGGWSSTAVRPLTRLVNCAGYNNTGGNYSTTNILDVTNFIAQSAGSFFTNAAGGDFSLNNTAGRGALLRATGFPSLFPRGLTANFLDIGVSQHTDPTKLIIPDGMYGGMQHC